MRTVVGSVDCCWIVWGWMLYASNRQHPTAWEGGAVYVTAEVSRGKSLAVSILAHNSPLPH